MGTAKPNGRKYKCCLGQVFHSKLSFFAFMKEKHGTYAHLRLNLKSQPRFFYASFSLSVNKTVTVGDNIIKWVASFKSSLLLKIDLQETKTLQLN